MTKLNDAARKFADYYKLNVNMEGYDDFYAALEDEILWRTVDEFGRDEEARVKWEVALMSWKTIRKSVERVDEATRAERAI